MRLEIQPNTNSEQVNQDENMIILSRTGIDRGHVARGFVIASKGAALTFSSGSCRLTMDEYAYVSDVRLFIFCGCR